MTDLLAVCRLSERQLAAATGYSPGAVHRWCDGTAKPPADVVAWLKACAAVMAQLPEAPRRAA
jgi:hypothetical protein